MTTFTCTEESYDGIQRELTSGNNGKLVVGPGVTVKGEGSKVDQSIGYHLIDLLGPSYASEDHVAIVIGDGALIETTEIDDNLKDREVNAIRAQSNLGGASVTLSGRIVLGSAPRYANGVARRQFGILAAVGHFENIHDVRIVLKEGSRIEHRPGGHGVFAADWGTGNIDIETEAGSLIDTSTEGGLGILGWLSASSAAKVGITHRGIIKTSVKRDSSDVFRGVGILGAVGRDDLGSFYFNELGTIAIKSAGGIETVQAPGIVAYAASGINVGAHTVTVESGGTVTTHGSTAIQALHLGTGGSFAINVAEGATVAANTETDAASCALKSDCVADDSTLRDILDLSTVPEASWELEGDLPPWWEVEEDDNGNIISYSVRVHGISILRTNGTAIDEVTIDGTVIATGSESIGVHLSGGGRVLIGPAGIVRGGKYGVEIGGGREDHPEDRRVEVYGTVRGEEAAIHLERGGLVIVGPAGQVIGGVKGVAILANDPSDVVVLYQVDERGNIGLVRGGPNVRLSRWLVSRCVFRGLRWMGRCRASNTGDEP